MNFFQEYIVIKMPLKCIDIAGGNLFTKLWQAIYKLPID